MSSMHSTANKPDDSRPVRVVIVDDSSMTRWLMKQILDRDSGIEVVGVAADASEARHLIKALDPDVITLDVEMPGVNGIDFLRNLMRARPMPVVMVSSLTQRGAQVTLDALSLGAVDFVSKPKSVVSAEALADYSAELIEKVRVASSARVHAPTRETIERVVERAKAMPTSTASADSPLSKKIVAIGASTGGTEAIFEVLKALPEDGPGIVIVQHISDAFNEPFVQRLDRSTRLKVCSPVQHEPVRCGHAYVAPPGHHMQVARVGDRYICKLTDGRPVHFQKPSVDVLFRSVAETAGADALGVILTGMGCDGARGLLMMRDAGGYTIAQDEASSVVWGMPGASVAIGAAAEIAALEHIGEVIESRRSDC